MTLRIANRDARRLWLASQGLTGPRLKPLEIIQQLGFIQLDTIQVVARAQHHILWSRNPAYREPVLNRLLKQGKLFEHFTHDASVLPIETYPFWRRRFAQIAERVHSWLHGGGMLGEEGRDAILERIRREGPLSTHAFDTKVEGKREMWKRPPHKLALDYLWYAGVLSTARRDGFTKVYDLTERVIPAALLAEDRSHDEQVEWLCRRALNHLAFGSEGDIQRFWAAVKPAEVKAWVHAHRDEVVEVEIEGVDGTWRRAWAVPDIEARLAAARKPTSAIRILNPFDPAIRDRTRLQRLFGFDFTIEIFVPAAKRQFGYYVYPLLEGDRFIGRMEITCDRKAGRLTPGRLWLEPKVKWADARRKKLAAEMARFAKLAGVALNGEPTLSSSPV